MPTIDTSQVYVRGLRAAWREATSLPHGLSRVMHAVAGRVQGRAQMRFLFGLPTYISIEVTNRCASSCVLCPVGQRRRDREGGSMPWERFTALVDEVSPHARFIGLYNWGDPFLHPRIYDMIEYVAAQKIHVKLSSTLRNWSPGMALRLVRSGLDDLKVSLHGAAEQSYADYQPRRTRADIGFSEALEKIRAIQRAKAMLGVTHPNITLGFIVTRNNENEIEAFKALARDLGVDFSLEETSLNLRLLPYSREMQRRDVDEATLAAERKALAERWLPCNERYVSAYYRYIRKHAGALPPPGTRWFECKWPWQQVVISSNGDVRLCCGSFARGEQVGNVFEEPLRKIWNNPLYRAARACIAGKPVIGAPAVLCQGCPGRLL
jgi:MoaA/NifB/PqqE/SkfB family radical SAM enzyme